MWVLQILPSAAESQFAPTAPPGGDTQGTTTPKKNKNRGPYYLTAGTHVVGRKECDLVIHWDKSISRSHAKITVRPLGDEEVDAIGTTQAIEVEDLGAKFGTRVNDEEAALPQGVARPLRSGDVLTFGNLVKARLWSLPLVLCCSSVSVAGRHELKAMGAKVGANVVNKWGPTCTHVVVDDDTKAQGTIKVVSAIVLARPIVQKAWLLKGLGERTSLSEPLPDPAKYTADLTNLGTLVRHIHRDRTQHFHNYVFVFVAPSMMEAVVQSAGATVVRAYEWDAAQCEDLEGTIAGLRPGAEGKERVIVAFDLDKDGDAVARALLETVGRVAGVFVTTKGLIAKSIFACNALRNKDDRIIRLPVAAPPAPEPEAATATAKAAPSPAPAAAAHPAPKKKAPPAVAEKEVVDVEKEERQQEAEVPAAPASTTPSKRATRRGGDMAPPTPQSTGRATLSAAKTAPTAADTTEDAPSSSRKRRQAPAAAVKENEPEVEAVSPSRSASKRTRKAIPETSDGEAERGVTAAMAVEGKGPPAPQEEEEEEEVEEVVRPSKRGGGRGRKAAEPEKEQEKEAEEEISPSKRKGGRGRKTTKETPAPPPPPPSATEATAPSPSKAAASAPQPFKIQQRAPEPRKTLMSPVRLNPAEGWLVASHKAPAQSQDGGTSQRRPHRNADEEEEEPEGGRGRRGEEEDEDLRAKDGDELEGPFRGETLVEERNLVSSRHPNPYEYDNEGEQLASPGAAVDPNSRAAAVLADGGKVHRPDFKRFRKNQVRTCHDHVLKKTALVAVLPKESEMELQLRNMETTEIARREEMERLFDDDDAPKRRKMVR